VDGEGPAGERPTYVLVDGENIDVTLGSSILGGRPEPEQRPRWERVLDFAGRLWDGPPRGLFFLNASTGAMPMTFVQALLAIGFRPIPLSGGPTEKVVDIGIKRTLAAIGARDGNALLLSHDRDFAPELETLLGLGRRVGIIAFTEFLAGELRQLADQGLELHDLELDVHAFTVALPRVRIIPIEEFDPTAFL